MATGATMDVLDYSNLVPQNQQLAQNPQLPQTAMGEWADSIYAAQMAQLRASISKQYADIVSQIGWKDPKTGAFIPGTIEADANRARAEQQHQIGLADEDVMNTHQQLGTIFSGRLGEDIAHAEHPFVQAIADLDIETPRNLAKLYKQAAGLTDEFVLQQNLNIAEASDRMAQRLLMQQAAGGNGGGGGVGGPTGGAPSVDPTSGLGGGASAYQAYGSPLGWQSSEFNAQGKKNAQFPYGGGDWSISGTGTQVGHA